MTRHTHALIRILSACSLLLVASACGELTVEDHDSSAPIDTPAGETDTPPSNTTSTANNTSNTSTPEPEAPANNTTDEAPVQTTPAMEEQPPAMEEEPPMMEEPPPMMEEQPPEMMEPPLPNPQECLFTSPSYNNGMRLLDIMAPSTQRLTYRVHDLPDPSLITRATLTFDTHDADHPGQEGEVFVNGTGGLQIPANAAWDNKDSTARLDVTGMLQAGTNTIEFGAGGTQRTYYKIGRVALEVEARVTQCVAPPEPPPAQAVTLEMSYLDARYTKRQNWVIRCNDYAFTARGDEHHATDCDGDYAPDGSRKGKVHFEFSNVTPATYEVRIHARHTENRNPNGALFIVNGVEKRILQHDPQGRKLTTVWGEAALSGDVTVTLDSSREGESDSIIWVKLVPVAAP